VKKVMLDIGHGGSDTGAIGNGLVEKNVNLEVGLMVFENLKKYDAEVRMTRNKDITLDTDVRVKTVTNFNPNLCVSIHHNAAEASSARGAEVIHAHYDKEDDVLAKDILHRLSKAGMPVRRDFTKLNSSGSDWYYMIRRIWDNDTDAIITEGGFLTNKEDASLLKDKAFLAKEAKAISDSIVKYLDLKLKQDTDTLTSIMGKAEAKLSQMVSFALKGNKSPALPHCSTEELAQIFIEEAEIEGVRADVAWAQSLKETGYFKYGGIVVPEQNNYSGIGALNGNGKGQAASFDNPRLGVRAQIQHLKAYASTEPLKQECVDPRFSLVKRGSSKYVEWLGYKNNPNGAGWAYPGDGYGHDIVKLVNLITKEPVAEEHWGDKYIQKMKELGIITGEHKALDELTWAEFAAVIVKLLDMMMKK